MQIEIHICEGCGDVSVESAGFFEAQLEALMKMFFKFLEKHQILTDIEEKKPEGEHVY